MVRAFLFVIFAAAVFASILHAGIWVFVVPLALLMVLAYVGGMRTSCPKCKKRIKLGATVCHHCGWQAMAKGQ
jgi:hypothetical protein